MTKTTISSEGTITIPEALREELHLEPGTELEIEVIGRKMMLKRAMSELPDWRTMEGMARGDDSLTEALMEERAADKAHDEARVKGH